MVLDWDEPGCKFTGKEPSPKGLGMCSHLQPIGKVFRGKDGNDWIVKSDKNGRKSWRRLAKIGNPPSSSSNASKKKSIPSPVKTTKSVQGEVVTKSLPFVIDPEEVISSLQWNTRERTLKFKVRPYTKNKCKMPQSAHETVAEQLAKIYEKHMQRYLNDCFKFKKDGSPWQVLRIVVVAGEVEVTLKSRDGRKQFPRRNPYFPDATMKDYHYGWVRFTPFISDVAQIEDGQSYDIKWPLCKKKTH